MGIRRDRPGDSRPGDSIGFRLGDGRTVSISVPGLAAPAGTGDVTTRHAACSCEQLRVEVEGEPVRVSICHCLACQRRTGSAFGVQSRFPADRVRIEGRYSEYTRISDDGEKRVFSFCPECGATVFFICPSEPDLVAVPVGAFADPEFPAPTVSVYESRRHSWVALPPSTTT